jgi:transposase
LSKTNREFSPKFRGQVVRRIMRGESVTKLHRELEITRSILYRWRDAYRKKGAAGLGRKVGRPAGVPNPTPQPSATAEESLRKQVAALERKVGQQALQLDFFQRAFKRVKESNRASRSAGATASTRKSGR